MAEATMQQIIAHFAEHMHVCIKSLFVNYEMQTISANARCHCYNFLCIVSHDCDTFVACHATPHAIHV